MDWSGTSPPVQGGVDSPILQVAYIQEVDHVETYRLNSGQVKRVTVNSVVVILHDGLSRVKAQLLCDRTVNGVRLESDHVIRLDRFVIRLWREDGVDAADDAPWMQVLNILSCTPLGNPGCTIANVDPTSRDFPWADSEVQVPDDHEELCAPHRTTRRWGEVDEKFRQPGVVECNGLGCSADTGEILTDCVVHHYPVPDFRGLLAECDAVDDLYKGPSGEPERGQPDLMPPNLRRWVLYYYYATQIFGYRARTRLPLCVEAAVRATWPNPLWKAYTGFQPAP
jgi:hypothetical protein